MISSYFLIVLGSKKTDFAPSYAFPRNSLAELSRYKFMNPISACHRKRLPISLNENVGICQLLKQEKKKEKENEAKNGIKAEIALQK